MGDPKKHRKKYSTPTHPWQKERILQEKELMREYGFKNKKELWKANSKLRNCSDQAKNLIPLKTAQAEKEKKQLIHKLQNLGLIEKASQLEDVLGITLKDLLARRLQTFVLKKEFANSIKQARQFIVHEHIFVGGKKITTPSYIVSKKEEGSITFAPDSKMLQPDHPERMQKKKKEKPRRKEVRRIKRRRR